MNMKNRRRIKSPLLPGKHKQLEFQLGPCGGPLARGSRTREFYSCSCGAADHYSRPGQRFHPKVFPSSRRSIWIASVSSLSKVVLWSNPSSTGQHPAAGDPNGSGRYYAPPPVQPLRFSRVSVVWQSGTLCRNRYQCSKLPIRQDMLLCHHADFERMRLFWVTASPKQRGILEMIVSGAVWTRDRLHRHVGEEYVADAQSTPPGHSAVGENEG